jgi:hypothetical protein
MGGTFSACARSRLGLSLIQDAHSGFHVLGGYFVERVSDLRHWKSLRLWPSTNSGTKLPSRARSTRMRLFDRAANNRIDRT